MKVLISPDDDMKQQMQLHLHEQYAINNNAHTSSLIAFVSALMVIFIGYGIVYHGTIVSNDLCACCRTTTLNTFNTYSICELRLITIAAIGILCFLACLCVIIGYGQRRDQIVIQQFRKEVRLNVYGDATSKSFCTYLPDYYKAFFLLFWLFEVLLLIVTALKIHPSLCVIQLEIYCYLFYVFGTILLILPWVVSICFYFKYQKFNHKDTNMKLQKMTDVDFIKSTPDYEHYVMVHSSAFEDIYDSKVKDAHESNELEGLVKISYNGHTVYRKCIGRNIGSKNIEVGYRTKSELGADYGADVVVEPAGWFAFYWHNSYSYYKWPFRIAFIAAIVTTLSFIKDIILLFL